MSPAFSLMERKVHTDAPITPALLSTPSQVPSQHRFATSAGVLRGLHHESRRPTQVTFMWVLPPCGSTPRPVGSNKHQHLSPVQATTAVKRPQASHPQQKRRISHRQRYNATWKQSKMASTHGQTISPTLSTQKERNKNTQRVRSALYCLPLRAATTACSKGCVSSGPNIEAGEGTIVQKHHVD